MRYYQEITLRETPEISPYFIWSRLYTQVHLALVEQQNSDKTVNIGVSFPEYFYREEKNTTFSGLGGKLRVFAQSKEELERVSLNTWLNRLLDYVHISEIKEVPQQNLRSLTFSNFKKIKNRVSVTKRFMRRESTRSGRELNFNEAQEIQKAEYAKRHKISLEAAEKQYTQQENLHFPFIKMESLSNRHKFSLKIQRRESDTAKKGTFNTYGLSSKATVPDWD